MEAREGCLAPRAKSPRASLMSLYPANPTGLPARRAALKLLDAVLRRGEPLDSALHAATQGLGQRADRALTHAIVAAVLRSMPDLDALTIGRASCRERGWQYV